MRWTSALLLPENISDSCPDEILSHETGEVNLRQHIKRGQYICKWTASVLHIWYSPYQPCCGFPWCREGRKEVRRGGRQRKGKWREEKRWWRWGTNIYQTYTCMNTIMLYRQHHYNYPWNNPLKAGIITPNLQMRNLRYRGIDSLAPSFLSRKCQSWAWCQPKALIPCSHMLSYYLSLYEPICFLQMQVLIAKPYFLNDSH